MSWRMTTHFERFTADEREAVEKENSPWAHKAQREMRRVLNSVLDELLSDPVTLVS